MYYALTHSEEDDKRGKKFPKDHCWRITEESSILRSSSLQNYLDVTSMPINYLEGMAEKSLSSHFTANVSAWSLLNATGTLT